MLSAGPQDTGNGLGYALLQEVYEIPLITIPSEGLQCHPRLGKERLRREEGPPQATGSRWSLFRDQHSGHKPVIILPDI